MGCDLQSSLLFSLVLPPPSLSRFPFLISLSLSYCLSILWPRFITFLHSLCHSLHPSFTAFLLSFPLSVFHYYFLFIFSLSLSFLPFGIHNFRSLLSSFTHRSYHPFPPIYHIFHPTRPQLYRYFPSLSTFLQIPASFPLFLFSFRISLVIFLFPCNPLLSPLLF